ncbi:glycoprotein [Raspberry vein chlorosis virus]|uniref:Glycoprotein n=1 Tax=Raspberry vein chlorosis virus TaxID=758677 RepID=A0A482PGU2_9RHAB|nr:glycoprotein [Raspberry vein chlorosis virus]QBS46634.1 glycoprotein [Raspberry vein chlorosis virus]
MAWYRYLLLSVCIMTLSATTTGRRGATESSIQTKKRSVGPVADCTGEIQDIGIALKNCYALCEGYEEPKQGVSVDIYTSDAKGPGVTSCSKIRLSQTYTKTWTFSTIDGEIRREVLPVTIDECKKEKETKCPLGNCDTRGPNRLEPEYHYASDTIVSATILELFTAESVIFFDNGKEMITPMGTTIKVESQAGVAQYDNKVFLWDKIETMTSCPYKSVGIYGCDQFDEGDEMFYACAGGGITVTPLKKREPIHKKLCPNTFVSEEGFLYGLNTDNPKGSKTGRLAINVVSDTAETADAAYLRHKIQLIATKLDSDLCYTQCEVMSLESRASNKTSHLMRIGHKNYLAYSNGSASECYPLHGCRLAQPSVFCGSPTRVGLVCNGISRLWNPLHPYLISGRVCPRPGEVENLTFSLGSTMYNVDNKLEIEVPKSELHGVYQSEFLRYHNSRSTLNVVELDTMGNEWRGSKEFRHEIKQATNRVINAPHVSVGSWVMSSFSSVGAVIHSIEAILGLGLVVIVLIATISMMMKIYNVMGGPKRAERRLRTLNAMEAPEYQLVEQPRMSWME